MEAMIESVLQNSSENRLPTFNLSGDFRKQHLTNQLNEIRGKVVRIVTNQNPPLNYAEMENGSWVGKGVAFDFIHYIKDQYNFDYTLTVREDNVLGDTTDGIFGDLAENRADVAAAFLPLVPRFNHIIEFSPTLDIGEWVVLMKRPLESATGSGLLAPFNVDVWIITLVTLIFMGPVISLLVLLHKKFCPGEQKLTHSLHASMWFVYGALIKQGSVLYPTADSTRLIFATWWIFITILTAFYTANLTAFLTLSVFTLPVSKTSDIGAKHYSWVTDQGNIIQEEESKSLNADLKGARATFVNMNREEILQSYVKKQNFLYIEEKLIVEHLMYQDYLNKTRENITESERCVFVITKWSVLTRERAFAYNRNFSYKLLFDNILGHMVESGVVRYKLREHLPKASICPLNLKTIERQLRNTDFLLTYYVITTGFGLSLVSFLLEVAIGTKLKASARKKVEAPRETASRPPPYHTLFGAPFNYGDGKKEMINGRDYWVVPAERGKKIFVPVRAPSSLLFQYTH